MPAPTNTYDSAINLNLSQVPKDIQDPALYEALLDIHNALESLVTHTDDGDLAAAKYIAKRRNITLVGDSYLVLTTDGTVLVDASAATADVVITLPPVADILGYRFEVKRIDPAPVAYYVNLIGDGGQLIDEKPAGVRIASGSSYTIKATDAGWVII